jgi:hypothetical protein
MQSSEKLTCLGNYGVCFVIIPSSVISYDTIANVLQACSSGRNISLWNLPAAECTLNFSTRASVQDLLFDNNQVSWLTVSYFSSFEHWHSL